jgi:hypothetical protein
MQAEPQRPSPQMRAAHLENQNGLAGTGGKEVKEHGLALYPLAGFEVTSEGRVPYSGAQIG